MAGVRYKARVGRSRERKAKRNARRQAGAATARRRHAVKAVKKEAVA